MEIRYKILEVNTANHQIIVRFSSDTYEPEVSAYNAQGQPIRYTTDYAITLPVPTPTGTALHNFILSQCPIDWFKIKAAVANPAIDTSMSAITPLVNVQSTYTVPTTPVPTNSEIVNTKWDLIKLERNRRCNQGGVKIAVNGVDKWFHSDLFSRSQHTGMILMGANLPNNIQWKTMDGSYVLMQSAIVKDILSGIGVSDSLHFQTAEKKKLELFASVNPATYDVYTGWQKIYGE